MSKELTTFNFEITSLQQAMDYAKLIADSDLAPKDYKGKPGNALVAIQYGVEIGLKPLQAIQNIAVINGRPCVYGDALIALVQNHPLCEYINETIKDGIAYCTVKRKGEEEHTATFSREDAKKAGLLGKAGPWSSYESRMLQMRARGFALRDKFSDVLKGMAMREEVEDYQVTDISSRVNKQATKTHVAQLIQSKYSNSLNYTQASNKIDDATCLDDLKDIPELVKHLIDSEKEDLRKKYKEKKQTFESINNETGEITENKPKSNTEFDKIKKQLMSAKSRDTLDVAADLISSCDDLEQKLELSDIYNKRKDEVK